MGQERMCTVRHGKGKSPGKALLETAEILFRGSFRLKIPFVSIKSVQAIDGELRVQSADGLTVFELGAAAEKWRDKILHPKTRFEKLGLKTGAAVGLAGSFDDEFLKELRGLTTDIAEGRAANRDLFFFAAGTAKDLARVAGLAKQINGAGALWIVYPKGRASITENGVISAGRKAGLKDVKVVGFSATHTALKFVIPVAKR